MPSLASRISGVLPHLPLAFTSAPFLIKNLTVAVRPFLAARISAELFLTFTSALFLSFVGVTSVRFDALPTGIASTCLVTDPEVVKLLRNLGIKLLCKTELVCLRMRGTA